MKELTSIDKEIIDLRGKIGELLQSETLEFTSEIIGLSKELDKLIVTFIKECKNG